MRTSSATARLGSGLRSLISSPSPIGRLVGVLHEHVRCGRDQVLGIVVLEVGQRPDVHVIGRVQGRPAVVADPHVPLDDGVLDLDRLGALLVADADRLVQVEDRLLGGERPDALAVAGLADHRERPHPHPLAVVADAVLFLDLLVVLPVHPESASGCCSRRRAGRRSPSSARGRTPVRPAPGPPAWTWRCGSRTSCRRRGVRS